MGPWNIQWKKYISCTQGGVCTSVCLRFNDDGKRWNVFLLRHSAEDTRWYQKKVVDLTRILPLNVTEKWQFLFQNDQSAATRFIFFMVTNEFVSWRSNSLFPNEKNWDIFIEKKNLLLSWPRSTLYALPKFRHFDLAKNLFKTFVVEC